MSGVDIAGLVEELRRDFTIDLNNRKSLEPFLDKLGKDRGRAADALLAQAAELAEARALIDRLRLEAQIHAGEARCHKATVHEAYQVCSGATGEPGNWHGAEPIRKALTEATRQRDEALAALKASEEARDAATKLADRYGVALMMIRAGCSNPQRFAGNILDDVKPIDIDLEDLT